MQRPAPTLVVGLGNPGPEYADTRHNIGFMVVDALLASLPQPAEGPVRGGASQVWTCRFAARRVWFQKPLTYMNLSGAAVAALCRRHELGAADVLVICDDADLPLGRLRLRARGSSGGHHGLDSLIADLGGDEFARLRVGIGRQTAARPGLVDFVLAPFLPAEDQLRRAVVKAAADAVRLALRRGLDVAMNEYNGRRLDQPEAGTAPAPKRPDCGSCDPKRTEENTP